MQPIVAVTGHYLMYRYTMGYTSCTIIHAVMCVMNSSRLRKRLRLPNCNCSIAVLDEVSQFPLYPTVITWCML